MKTKEEFESFVSGLTELEMSDLLQACNQKIIRDQMGALVDIFRDEDLEEEMERIQDNQSEEIADLEKFNDNLRSEISKVLAKLDDCVNAIEEDHPGWELPELAESITILENI